LAAQVLRDGETWLHFRPRSGDGLGAAVTQRLLGQYRTDAPLRKEVLVLLGAAHRRDQCYA
jgi:hypothetical protein